MEGGTILIGAGRAIAALGLLDTLVVLSLGLMAVDLAVPRGIVGRVQAPVSLFVAIGVLTAAIATATKAIAIMVGLLLAVPFGTIVYLLVWAGFPVGKAAAMLGLIMGLKLTGAVLLAVAHRGFLGNKGLLALLAASIASTWLVGVIHRWPPGFLATIADGIAALVVAAVAGLWSVFLIVGSLVAMPALLRSLRPV